MNLRSVQTAHVRLQSIEAGVARMTDGPPHAIVEVQGMTLHLLSAGVQEEIMVAFRELLNGLREPLQILVRCLPSDMAPRRERFLRDAPPEYGALAHDYAEFLERTAAERTLLERRYYLIVPAPSEPPARRPQDREKQDAAVRTHLNARCEALVEALRRCHLDGRRLGDVELAELYYACWCPDLATRQRIHGTLEDWTALVVGAEGPSRLAAHAPATLVAGTRRLADLVAPGSIERSRSWLRLDDEYVRTLYVSGLPRRVGMGWLAPLLDEDEPVELALHIHPLPIGPLAAKLDRRRLDLLSSGLLAARRGQVTGSQERQTALDDVEGTRDALQLGVERAFACGLYLCIRARSEADLDARTDRLRATLDRIMAHARVALFQQEDGFQSILPQASDRLRVHRNLTTTAVATSFPFTSGTLAMERGLFVGVTLGSQSPVLLDPFDPSLTNANMAVFGTSGGGKSYFLKVLARRAVLHGTDVWIVDREREYGALASSVPGSQRITLGAGSSDRLNPFDLARDRSDDADPLAEQIAALKSLLGVMVSPVGQGLSKLESATLDTALYETYRARGITADRSTHARPVPRLTALHARLRAESSETARSLADRLLPYISGSSAGLFDAATTVGLDGRLIVFDVSNLDQDTRPLATHLLATWLWQRARSDPRPRLLLVDEAWDLLRSPDGSVFLESMARRARKHRLGLVTATQDVVDVFGTAGGRAISTNAAITFLFHQAVSAVEPVVTTYDLSPRERHFLLAAGRGDCLVFARGAHAAVHVTASDDEHAMATASPFDLSQRRVLLPSVNGHALGESTALVEAAP